MSAQPVAAREFAMTQTVTKERAHTLTKHLPPYSVILHNDESHSMEYVVQALVKSVPELSTERAIEVMIEAHTSDAVNYVDSSSGA